MSEIQIKPLYLSDPMGVPQEVKVNPWQKAKNAIWNTMRRPLVRMRQRELRAIASGLKDDMAKELFPLLWQVRHKCQACRESYASLNSEVFVSSMKLILTRMKCDDHASWYIDFLVKHEYEFERNESVSRWINGL
jgi:hypothetical protein